MYLRKINIKKDGKYHPYWALVESYRTHKGPRQRIVCYLGEMDKVMPSDRAKVAWADLACVLTVARFCNPSSELYIAEHFYGHTAFADILGIPAHQIYENRLYRALDKLLLHKESLEQHLKERFGELFNRDSFGL